METIPWILIGIAVLIALLAVIAIILLKGKKTKPDYYAFFIIGITWLPLGIALGNQPMFILGLVFLGVGLANKSKWKENRQKWENLSKNEKTIRMIILGAGVLLLVLGVLAMFLVKNNLI